MPVCLGALSGYEERIVDRERDSMLEVNREQAAYYDRTTRRSAATRLMGWVRGGLLGSFRKESGLRDAVYDLHREWLGDLSGLRVLDLGCYAGNFLSLEIARSCGEYVGLDLSEQGISRLRDKLEQAGLENATAIAGDFLDPEVVRGPFDVVYAYGVLHHFRYLEACLARLREVLRPGGRIVAYDPMETALVVRAVRRAYRPFQSDAAWEWPFHRGTFPVLASYFEIEKVQGVLGHSKWALPFYLVPFPSGVRRRLASRLHARDMKSGDAVGPGLWRCMHVATLMRAPRHGL